MRSFTKFFFLSLFTIYQMSLVGQTVNSDIQTELDSLCGVKSCEIIFSKMKKFARNGSAHAQAVMSLLYRGGYGTEANEERSLTYMKRSAKQGFPFAEYYLGLIYREGKLLQQNDAEAEFWLRKAAMKGYKKAIDILYKEGKLSKEEVVTYESKYREPEIKEGEHVMQITRDRYSLSDLVELLASLGYGNATQTGSRIKGKGCGKNASSCISWNINSPIGRTQFSTMISKINALETALQMAGQRK